jgi:hypothetical protein
MAKDHPCGVQATNDVANRTIIKLTRQFDLKRQITVGILPNPSFVHTGSGSDLASVVEGEDVIKLKFADFLLKNPGPLEIHQGLTMATRLKASWSLGIARGRKRCGLALV